MTDTTRTTPMTEMTQTTEAADMLSTLRAIPGLRRAWPAGRDSEPASASIECVLPPPKLVWSCTTGSPP